jgi:hypothetical protein
VKRFIGLLVIGLSWSEPSPARAQEMPSADVIRFAASVTHEERFERPIGRDMVFELRPNSEGWTIGVVIRKRPDDEHRERCEPLHGGSECDFIGEYFTPNSQAWGYLKSRVRQFRFGLGRQLPVSDQEQRDNPDWWRTPEYEKWGKGTFTIEDITLGPAKDNEGPSIASMRFRVDLQLPR